MVDSRLPKGGFNVHTFGPITLTNGYGDASDRFAITATLAGYSFRISVSHE